MLVRPPPPRAAMDGHELAEDVVAADDQAGRLAAILQVLRLRPIEANGKICVPSPMLGPAIDDRRRADPAVLPEPHVRPDRPHSARRRCPRRSAPSGCTIARGSMSTRRGAAEQQVGLGHDLVADDARCRAPRPAARAAGRASLRAAAGRRGRPDGGIWPCRRRAERRVGRRPARGRAAGRRHLRQRFDHQHTRHQRAPGKVPLEELLVDRDVLVRDEAPPRLVLQDDVEQIGRVAVRAGGRLASGCEWPRCRVRHSDARMGTRPGAGNPSSRGSQVHRFTGSPGSSVWRFTGSPWLNLIKKKKKKKKGGGDPREPGNRRTREP